MSYLKFDIEKTIELVEDFTKSKQAIKEILPDVNWNSRLETINFFKLEFGLELTSLKIEELERVLEVLEQQGCYPERTDTLGLLIEYYKIHYIVRNYLLCILKHQKDGIVTLRSWNDELVMPNRQPLPKMTEIVNLIIEQGVL